MMLHEAVMLEIYRQALTASELTSPRCQSRESNISAAAIDGRCPSNGSHCSGNDRSATPATATSHPNTPPAAAAAAAAAGLPLTATLAPAAAAALLPPQSAAMAAYFNAAAAAAAQQNHLLLTNPLAAAASLVQHATRAPHSPAATTTTAKQLAITPPNSADQHAREMTTDEPVLDFSTKRQRQSVEDESDEEDDVEEDAKMVEDNEEELANATAATGSDVNSPLDLSCGRKRESCDGDDEEMPMPARKTLRTMMHHHNNNNSVNNYNTLSPGNWMPAINPYLAAVAAASLSPPKSPLSPMEWNGKHKLLPNEATKALEKMTEMTRLGSATDSAELPQHRHANSNSGSGNGSSTHTGASSGGGGGGRHSAWQSHWLNKGADAVRDVFKCVWCKQSFPTLATLTVHMKETQHCGVSSSMPPIGATNNQTSTHGGVSVSGGSGNGGMGGIGGGVGGGLGSNLTTQSSTHHLRHTTNGGGTPNHNNLPHPGTPVNASHTSSSSASASPATNKSDLNFLIKETMPLPRKLVRGQDVWLGKGAEQTREILKCMWCGQSFRSLAEMTAHMQETQHYTNIISQEQIISWKSTDDKHSTGSGVGGGAGGGGGTSGVGGAGSSSHSTTGPLSTSPAVTTPPSMASSSLLSSPNNNNNNNNMSNNNNNTKNNNNANSAPSATATVAAVLTCKVCDSAFPTLKELSQHMMKYAHYQEQMMRALASAGGGSSAGGNGSGAENSTSAAAAAARRGRQMREKRKKSLPVRKLLEMERNAQQDYKNSLDPALKPLRDFAICTKITCETCGEKVETALFVEHIRRCLSGSLFEPKHKRAQHNQSGGGGAGGVGGSSIGGSSVAGSSSDFSVGGEPLRPTFASMSSYEPLSSPQTPTSRSDGRKTSDSNISHVSHTARTDLHYALPKEAEKTSNSSTPSVLNALEQLIEKSFDTRARNCNSSYSSQAGGGNGSQRSTPLGSSILRRLGIDDSIDYTKPLLDPQTMNFMRSSYSGYSTRDRSASESSSISERCNSRIEAFTPERMERPRYAPSTPRLTPEEEKQSTAGVQGATAGANNENVSTDQMPNGEMLHIKSEPLDGAEEPQELSVNDNNNTNPTGGESPQKISVKKEFNMFENQEEERHSNDDSAQYKSQTQTISPRPTSPSASERSLTPKSTTSSERAADKRYSSAVAAAPTPTPTPIPTPTTPITPTAPAGSSLNALSSMFENLNNMSTSGSNAAAAQLHAAENLTTGIEKNNNNTNKKSNANPLAALQKLCETTEKSTTPAKSTTRRSSTTTNGLHHHHHHHNTQLAGNMMAFSWACNDAVQQQQQQQQQTNAAETHIKCSQCDAVFSSKGSYRHHFSKVHFVKDEIEVKSPTLASSPKSAATSPKSTASKSPVGAGAGAGGMAAPIINPYNESSESKFLKYTELAKQLSSKNA